jgi:hypothetical protein
VSALQRATDAAIAAHLRQNTLLSTSELAGSRRRFHSRLAASRQKKERSPRLQQQDRYDRQPNAEAPPQSHDAHVAVEAEVEGDGEADEPVADEVGDERVGGVAGAAEDARADGLQSIGELEDGGDAGSERLR